MYSEFSNTPASACRTTGRHIRTLLIGCAITPLLVATATFAEEAAKDSEEAALEEITVTGSYTTNERLDSATGLGLSLMETPQSVSVMTFQRLEDQDLQSLTDVVLNAVGVSAKEFDSSRFGFSSRGFPIQNYQIDGVPIAWSPGGDAGETQQDTVLYERVEIVRGSTGLLTGAGDPSASINLVRKHATSQELVGNVSAEVGSWNSYGVVGDLSAALDTEGKIRGRVVAKYKTEESYRDLWEDETLVLYGVLEADITEDTLIRLGASYQDNNPTASTWGGLPSWHADGSRTNWDRSKTIGADWTSWASDNKNYYASLIHEFGNGWFGKVNYNRNENSSELRLLYLYGVPDRTTGLGLGPSPYRAEGTSKQDSIDFQIKGTYDFLGRDHELVFGALYSTQDTINSTYTASDYGPIGNFNEWDGSYPEPTWSDAPTSVAVDYSIEQTGFYAATRLSVTDALKVVLGGRIAKWEQDGVSYGTELDFGDSGVFIPYAGVLYNLTENNTLYASYTEIFEAQNYQDRNGDYLDPLVGKSYEVGLKSSFMDGALHATASLFLIKQDNLAQVDTGHLIPGTIFEAYYAADGTESKGFEIELVGEPLPGWNISLGYTQFKAEDAEGNKVNTDQPRKLLKIFTTYDFQGDWQGLTVGGGLNWEDSNYTDAFNPVTGNPEKLQQDAYALVSLMARYDFNESLSAQINVENLFDETYYSQIGFYSQLAYGAPRNFNIRLRYDF
ncbi:TonB-dependent siderophore receptor [Emcibacter sp.]|uniref:TonB-dependent siderophore receptor n=1 Tax=Emcibacter sp. TaxID=1979954 RepID=UPI003A95D49A